jgi:hypothetical protein
MFNKKIETSENQGREQSLLPEGAHYAALMYRKFTAYHGLSIS